MKKKIFTLSLCTAILATTQVFAQTKEKEEKEDVIVEKAAFFDNWYVGLGLGTTVYVGDIDRHGSFGGRLAPALDLSVGKWFTPGVGARIQYSGPQLKGYTNDANNLFVTDGESNSYYKQKWNYMFLHADAMLNVSNFICGYNPDRLYSFIPYAGAGWMHTPKNGNDAIALDAGLYNNFKLNSKFDLFLDVRVALLGEDAFDREDGGDYRMEGIVTATIGATYRFGKRGWKRPTPQSTIDEYVSTIDSNKENLKKFETDLAVSKKENAKLEDQIAELNTKVQETKAQAEATAVVVKEPTSIFPFKINSSTLSNFTKLNLKNYAEFINSRPSDERYKVVGYSDKYTGTVEFNNKLSKKRAESAYDFLVNECDVDSTRLVVDSKGGVDNMFYDDAELSRVVIIKKY